MKLRFSRGAKDDLVEALAFVGQQGPRRRTGFREELRRCLQQVKATPLSWPRVSKIVRLRIMKKFQYGIYYEYSEPAAEILVGAVMYLGRSSGDWKERFEQ